MVMLTNRKFYPSQLSTRAIFAFFLIYSNIYSKHVLKKIQFELLETDIETDRYMRLHTYFVGVMI